MLRTLLRLYMLNCSACFNFPALADGRNVAMSGSMKSPFVFLGGSFVDTNPYQATTGRTPGNGESAPRRAQPRWRAVPAACVMICGTCLVLFGSLATAVYALVVFGSLIRGAPVRAVLVDVPALILSLMVVVGGCFWAASAMELWGCRWKRALAYLLVGATISALGVFADIGPPVV